MESRTIFRGAVALTAAVVLGPTVWAQESARRQDDAAKPQVQTFEMVLSRAIETAGRNFGTRATELAPAMMPVVFPTGQTEVTGVAVHDLGLYIFQVQVPDLGLTLQVMNMMANRPQTRVGVQAVGNGQVGAAGVVTPDPMGPPPAGIPPTKMDFEAEYRLQVKDALIEAILDNSATLPMAQSDMLLVVASGVEQAMVNPLYRMPSTKLVLRAKAADLVAFRDGKLSREEARQRVQATNF